MHFMFSMFGTFFLAGLIGYISEHTGWTRNGYLPSMIICIGGAFVFFFVGAMFKIGFGSPGLNAIISSIGALLIVPFHWRR